MARHKNQDWNIAAENYGYQGATLATLMDIRDELKRINQRLDCHETLAIPRILHRISHNTAKPRKRKPRTT